MSKRPAAARPHSTLVFRKCDVLRPVLCTQPRSATDNLWMRALVKLVASWVKVPPVELDGSRPKRGIRDEAVKPNHKRDAERNGRVVTKVNLI